MLTHPFRKGTPIADTFAVRERKKNEGKGDWARIEGMAWHYCLPALLLSSDLSLAPDDPPAPSEPRGVVVAFESCMLTMRTERGLGLYPPVKRTGILWTVFAVAHR
jgi:hypothetical protein